MVAKGNMRWVAQTFGDIELSVTFFIEKNKICTQTLQLHKGQGNLGVDLRKAYLPGVDMRDCYLGKKTMKGSNDILYERPGWNANLGVLPRTVLPRTVLTRTVLTWTVLP